MESSVKQALLSMRILASSRTIVAALLLILAAGSSAQQSEYTIEHLAGDVYMYSGGGSGTFMVTSEGVVMADAPNPGVSAWLKAEIQERFDLPITHLLYSHFHWDHASGGDVLAGATVIAHENFVKNLAGPSKDAPLSASHDYYDGRFHYYDAQGNGDGRLQINELNNRYKALLANSDQDGDGALSYYEVHQGQHPGVRTPDITFNSDVYTLTAGGKTVEMHYIFNHHSDDMSFIYYPDEKVLLVVDIISLQRLPWFNLGSYDPEVLDASIELALGLNAEIIVPGHGSVGDRKDLADFYAYMQALKAGVAAGIAADLSMERLQDTLLLEDYSAWGAYSNWRTANIEGMYNYVIRSKH